MYDLKLYGGQCYIDGQFEEVNIYIKDESIALISDEDLDALDSYNCTGYHILPGLIDPHVHLQLDLGRFQSADNFISGSKAAAYGGFTTLLDFLDPISENNQFDSALANRKVDAEGAHVDYGFHCTLGNYQDDIELLRERCISNGLASIKVFTTYSESDRRCDYQVIKKLYSKRLTVMAHAEEDSLVNANHSDIKTYESSRDENSELQAVTKLIEDHKNKRGNLYIVHTSSGETLTNIHNNFSEDGLSAVYFESCPQYFTLTRKKFIEEEGGKFLLAPPLRSQNSVRLLKENIGKIETIGTDHCPFMLEEKLKTNDASLVPKGIGGIESSFPLMYTLFGFDILDKYTKNPARLFGLSHKGSIAIGKDADFCIYDTRLTRILDSGHSRCDYSVYEGFEVSGEVVSTILRGKFILKDHVFLGGEGKFIRRRL